ncbi:MAG: hypothetical protein ABI856_01705 [Nitrospira sp.]
MQGLTKPLKALSRHITRYSQDYVTVPTQGPPSTTWMFAYMQIA